MCGSELIIFAKRILTKMEVFSLEDEYEGLFLTQSGSSVEKEKVGNSPICGNPMDFQSPCVSLRNLSAGENPVYSDISDAEDFDIPSSQVSEQEIR